MTPAERAEIRARAEAATPGPWERQEVDGQPTAGVGYRILAGHLERNLIVAEWRGDAAFIAHARTDIPALLDEVERTEGWVENLRIYREDWQRHAAAAEAEVGLLKEHLGRFQKFSIDSDRHNTRLLAEVERLRAALERYGQHEDDCPAAAPYQARLARDDDGSRASYPCTCGLDAALAFERKAEAESLQPEIDLALLAKLASGEGGRRTGALKRAGYIEWTVTPRGYAALLEATGATLAGKEGA